MPPHASLSRSAQSSRARPSRSPGRRARLHPGDDAAHARRDQRPDRLCVALCEEQGDRPGQVCRHRARLSTCGAHALPEAQGGEKRAPTKERVRERLETFPLMHLPDYVHI